MARTAHKVLRKPKRPLVSRQRIGRLIAVALGLWIAYLVFAGDTSLVRLWRLKGENQELRNKIAELERRLEEIDEEKQRLLDPAYLEKIAREEYGMIREGEIAYRVIRIPAEESRSGVVEDDNSP